MLINECPLLLQKATGPTHAQLRTIEALGAVAVAVATAGAEQATEVEVEASRASATSAIKVSGLILECDCSFA